MGLFDYVHVLARCPGCSLTDVVEAQTKDLESCMFSYHALSEDWETNYALGREFRAKLPVFPEFPGDKSAAVWASQAEQMEAQARVGDQLNYVNIGYDCQSCRASVCGKVWVKNGLLRYPAYDLEVEQREEGTP